jgi:beta-1,4-mannooligosaccharide/beta-1,4-mannosyl-N-acetylglucosamine phosphorylase
LEPDNTIKIYYGAADRCIGLAQANLEDLIQACYNKNAYLSKFFRKAD